MISTGARIRKRIVLSMAVFPLLFLLLAGQLFRLQIVRGEELTARAKKQWTSESVIAPRRGSITDRNGVLLAVSATAYIASVSPRQVRDAKAFSETLAPILDLDADVIFQKASDITKGGVTIKRQVSREIAQQLRAMMAEDGGKLDGLYLEEDSKRYYPMGAFASQLLGLTTIDGVGQAGLEQSLDAYLSGKAGASRTEVDGKGRALSYAGGEYVSAVDGGTVELTIDSVIQSFAEQAAREAMEVNNATGVRVLVMNPQTGAILALCVKPDFDPNDPPRDDVETLSALMRNRVVSDAYEPGSTFKILTTAVALDSGVASETDGFYCSGSVSVDGSRVRCWGRPHGAQTLAEGLCNSCNPVFFELGLRIGVSRFYDYLDAFGIGYETGVDIPGESGGIRIAESRVKRVDIVRIAFGQSVAVTPIQLLSAQCACVNGGSLMRPYVVSKVYAADGELIAETKPEVVSQPISARTSQRMRALLEKVVEEGGGRNAYIEGYRIGGKTGTAQVYKDGVIAEGVHIGSFVGFAPIDDPQIAVMVIVDEAQKRPDYGSVTAAPFARDILEKSLAYLGVRPDTEESEMTSVVPDVAGLSRKDAEKAVAGANLRCVIGGSGDTVTDQLPAAGARMPEGSLVMLYTQAEPEDAWIEVPDLAGLNVADATKLLAAYGLTLDASGAGVAVKQTPEAGTTVFPGAEVVAAFETPA